MEQLTQELNKERYKVEEITTEMTQFAAKIEAYN